MAVPGSSGKVAEGFGRVLGEKYWFFIDFNGFGLPEIAGDQF